MKYSLKCTEMHESIKIYFVDLHWLRICIFSRMAHYHMRSIYAHVWTAFIPSHGKKGLWLSPSIMWQLPIGLACWRGIMPQGQLRHNVSLSGCHTGQWQRVSHRRPTHPWAVPLPSSCLWQWKRWCGIVQLSLRTENSENYWIFLYRLL